MFELGKVFFSSIAEFFSLTFPGTNFTFFHVFIIFLILKVAISSVYIILGLSTEDTNEKPIKK